MRMCLRLALLFASLLRAASLMAVGPKPVRLFIEQVVTSVAWQTQCVKEGRRPLREGVDVSVLPNDKGQGLYALRDMDAGELIARYEGQLLEDTDYQAGASSGAYAMGLANGKVVDGEDPRRSNFVRYINHSVLRANCRAEDAFDETSNIAAVFLETTRPIRAGDELLFDYGAEYWDSRAPRFSPARLKIDFF